jgi:hypothetical protein
LCTDSGWVRDFRNHSGSLGERGSSCTSSINKLS